MSCYESLLWFAQQMGEKLDENDHRLGWHAYGVTTGYLLRRLSQEIGELRRAIEKRGDVIHECADVANYAMMIADRARTASYCNRPPVPQMTPDGGRFFPKWTPEERELIGHRIRSGVNARSSSTAPRRRAARRSKP